MKKILPFVGVVFSMLVISCNSEHSIIGTWELEKIQILPDSKGTPQFITITKEDPRYSSWRFHTDKTLDFTGKYRSGTHSAHYELQKDTIIITAENGYISQVPIIKRTKNEMILKDDISGNFVLRRVH